LAHALTTSDVNAILATAFSNPTPITLHDILNLVNKTKWLATMKREFNALVFNDTFKLCPLPKGWNGISTHWVLHIKADGNFRLNGWLAASCSMRALISSTPMLKSYASRIYTSYSHTPFY
jgi:hypothetical protein